MLSLVVLMVSSVRITKRKNWAIKSNVDLLSAFGNAMESNARSCFQKMESTRGFRLFLLSTVVDAAAETVIDEAAAISSLIRSERKARNSLVTNIPNAENEPARKKENILSLQAAFRVLIKASPEFSFIALSAVVTPVTNEREALAPLF